jgi:glycosyltransferase involved in cell wall biosynthesis
MNTQCLLSICIATKNRANFIRETLNSLYEQNTVLGRCEIVILDSSTNTDTFEVVDSLNNNLIPIKYIANTKLNLDEGYDAAVMGSNGTYCWLLPDDDLLFDNALSIINSYLSLNYDLILLNLQCYNKEMNIDLGQKLHNSKCDLFYTENNRDLFLMEMGILLSYIGSVIIKKSIWVAKSREKYFGTWFVHVGVILDSDLIKNIVFINKPLIKYRSGNSSWTDKSFEIWYVKWPKLIWSFSKFGHDAKNLIGKKRSWDNLLKLIKSRAMGEFNYNTYKTYICEDKLNPFVKYTTLLISIVPKLILNTFLIVYCSLFKRKNLYTIYNLIMSSPNKRFSISLARLFFQKFR